MCERMLKDLFLYCNIVKASLYLFIYDERNKSTDYKI